ncbi:GH116 family glycosyl hydrolase [Tengunoibacter tsumagoiensis]|uniref:Glucosylceramidase n=1 Tax=Tengunoibacter tsumagoiensis TaxID=2014871 RepID=A0A402A3F4_9CHLR|nr:GH116 family glycosyl hydrolase [Tengunoibacter tsumagoiensis]GCE13521.1 hypothetical protein KTT_33800 [Tengunoibacter tsumagoiensis]
MPYTTRLRYTDKARSGQTLGGLGTGGVELRQDGVFYNWQIANNFPFGTGSKLNFPENTQLFFLLRYQEQDKPPRLKLLQIDDGDYVANINNHIYEFPWMTGIEQIDYTASFPFTQLRYEDSDMPLTVTMEAFSPFIPHDVKNSSLPAVVFSFKVQSHAQKPVSVSLMGTMRNLCGYDVQEKIYTAEWQNHDGLHLLQMGVDQMDQKESSWGTQALGILGEQTPSYYLGWGHRHPFYEVVLRNTQLPNRDDTPSRNSRPSANGTLYADECMLSTLSVDSVLQSGECSTTTMVMSWHFPNFYAQKNSESIPQQARLEGNYYSNFFANAAEVAQYIQSHLSDLEQRTRQFHDDFYASTLPLPVLDQLNSQLNTFISSSWLTKQKQFGVGEGLTPAQPWAGLNTIDVALYGGHAIATLFPELEREVWLNHRDLQSPNGQMSHSIIRDFSHFDLDDPATGRVDLPAQYVIQAVRYALWTNDQAFLKEIWPSIKKTLAYVLRERDANGDFIPDVNGALTTSYDNFAMFGLTSYVGSLWLSALTYCCTAAQVLGDEETFAIYREVYQKAKSVFQAKLWNGHYYRLSVEARDEQLIIDEGCLTDQLIGQWCNYWCGLESIVDAPNSKEAVLSILSRNYEKGFGLRNCSWPEDTYLHAVPDDCWFDQANTFWSGVELAFASFLIWEGEVAAGFELVETVNQRYLKAGRYFNHQEWGGHYFRPLSAWALPNAVLGLSICAGTYRFSPRLTLPTFKLFFSFPSGTAHYIHDEEKQLVAIRVLSGHFSCSVLQLETSLPLDAQLHCSLGGEVVASEDYHYDAQTRTFVLTKAFTLAESQEFRLWFD